MIAVWSHRPLEYLGYKLKLVVGFDIVLVLLPFWQFHLWAWNFLVRNLAQEMEAEKKALIEQLSKPSGVSDEEGIRRGIKIIERAVSNGFTEVQVYRFPNALCADHGRAINQGEPGWEETLTGVPKEIYQLWYKYFRPRGYKLLVQIVDFPGGMPGDIIMTLKWI